MTFDERRTTVVQDDVDPTIHAHGDGRVVEERAATTVRPSGSTLASRVVILLFGLVQLLIALRILFLALDARRANDLVAAVLQASQVFVAPFEGLFRNDALSAGGSVLDIAAIAALVGWTLLELVILAVLRVPRRSEAV